ncbi:MAG: hypothetical protein RMX96_24650 [Nostoc sp. ChiSLP02]|nr:hypothetical protein [Nostoc sp. DedSLP05]MDZ8103220.1 hypothetical protein [Nostoc sp. DedSLP01]MDZ8188029.1 hypothetical protein [Nostoc sp. ChiSLP02]
MKNSLIVKPALILTILTIGLANYSPVQASIKETILQNQEQQNKQLSQKPSSQKLWEQFRRRQDTFHLQQQQRIEQFRQQNKLRQQPLGQFQIDQVRQQRREMDILKLQQQMRQQQ